MLQLYIANMTWFSIHLKWCSNFFRLHQVVPSLMAQIPFSQIQQAPGPGKIPEDVMMKLTVYNDLSASA